MNEFQPGDRVQTPTGKTGVIIEPEYEMPLHCLIEFSCGTKQHFLKRILKIVDD